MSADEIIKQIKSDAEKEIKEIKKEVDKDIKKINEEAKKQADQIVKEILEQGKISAENKKRIMISKANQESHKKVMNAKEEILEKCFSKAIEKLSKIKKEKYQKIIDNLIKKGTSEIKGKVKVDISKEADKKIVEKHKLEISNTIKSTGGIIIYSSDGKITLDNTFEGILKRKKSEIRNKAGKVLFS